MKSNIALASKFVGTALFACFMSLFVYLSLFFIVKTFSTSVYRYEVHVLDENGVETEVYSTDERPTETKATEKIVPIYTEMPKVAEIGLGVLQVVFGLGIYFCTTGSIIAKAAAKDRNEFDFNHVEYVKTRGLKIGFLAAVPMFLVYVATVICKYLPESTFIKWLYWIYRWILLCPVKPLADLFTGKSVLISDTPVYAIFALGIFTLLIIPFCHIMYVICFNSDSVIAKILYKSTKKNNNYTGRRLGGR